MKGHIEKRRGRYWVILERDPRYDEGGNRRRDRKGAGMYRTRTEAQASTRRWNVDDVGGEGRRRSPSRTSSATNGCPASRWNSRQRRPPCTGRSSTPTSSPGSETVGSTPSPRRPHGHVPGPSRLRWTRRTTLGTEDRAPRPHDAAEGAHRRGRGQAPLVEPGDCCQAAEDRADQGARPLERRTGAGLHRLRCQRSPRGAMAARADQRHEALRTSRAPMGRPRPRRFNPPGASGSSRLREAPCHEGTEDHAKPPSDPPLRVMCGRAPSPWDTTETGEARGRTGV
jgi:hypothetical protein